MYRSLRLARQSRCSVLLGLDALQVEPSGHPHVPAPPRVLAERPPVRLGRRHSQGLGALSTAAVALRAHPGPTRRAILVQRAAQARREPRAAARDDLLRAAPLVGHHRRRWRHAPLQHARGDPLRQLMPHPRLRRAHCDLRSRRGGAVIPPPVRSGASAAAADWWEALQLPRRLLDCIA